MFVCYLTFCGDLCRREYLTKNLSESETTKVIVKKEPVYIEVEKKHKNVAPMNYKKKTAKRDWIIHKRKQTKLHRQKVDQ